MFQALQYAEVVGQTVIKHPTSVNSVVVKNVREVSFASTKPALCVISQSSWRNWFEEYLGAFVFKSEVIC